MMNDVSRPSYTDLDRKVIEGTVERPASSEPLEKKAALKRLSTPEYDAQNAATYFQSDDFKLLAPSVFVKMSSGDHKAGDGDILHSDKETFDDLTEDIMNSDKEGSASECNSDVSVPSGECENQCNRSRLTRGSYDFVRAVTNAGSSDVEISTDDDSDFDSDLECSSLSVSECENEGTVDDKDDEKHQIGGHSDENQPENDEVDACILISEVRRGSYFREYEDRATGLIAPASQGEQFSVRGPSLNKKSRISRTLSYEQACSDEGSRVTIFNEAQSHLAGYDHSDIPADDLQLDSVEDFVEDSVEDSQVYDPHGLIRKPAMRRKGFAWSSKSLPRNASTHQMRQEYINSIDSSRDLESSLISLNGHRLAARTTASENADDQVVPTAARKTQSLPTKTDQLDEAHYRHVIRPTSGRPQRKMDTEAVLPKFVSTSGDNMKRPLSMSSVSSNSLTASPSLPKKKDSKADEDGSSFLDDLISNYTEASTISGTVSSLESRHGSGRDYFNENRNEDEFMDSTSITSSEADSLRNDSESSSVIPPISYDKVNMPSLEDPGINPVSPTELYSRLPEAQDDNTTGSADISRLSSSSISRHEARMKFFTNYEEYINQLTTPSVSVAEENVNSLSKLQSSSAFQVSASTLTSPSAVEVSNNGGSSSHSSTQDNKCFITPSVATTEDRKDNNSSKFSRSSERASRRSDRRGSNAKHEGLSSRSGFNRSSKKRDHVASSDPGSRSSQGFVSYVSRVVSEIIESERTYIASLEDIIHGYMEPMENILTSSDAKADLRCLFSNIRDIYKFGCTFLADLEIAGADCVQVAQCFVKHNQGFVIYTDYCTNYPRAVEVLTRFMQHPELSELCKQRQLALGHGLPLGAYLLKPVQRILKYHLLLHNLVKNCDKGKDEAEILEQAFHHMTEMAHHINEMKRKHEHAVRIQEIQSQLEDYVGEDLTRLGELVLEGTFKVYGAKAFRQVFLFERGLLISKKKGGGMLSCKAFIQCSNLMLVEVIPNEPLSFHIIPFDNPRAQYTLQARNMEQKKKWCQDIKQLILESFKGRIPDNVKNLIMQLGREHDDDYVSKEALEAGRKNQHTAPEYLEKRRFRGKSGSRIPDFNLLKPQKAKRGGNKKTEVRPRENISQERTRRESKSPEGHRRIFSKQNVVSKGRSQSPVSPPVQRSESYEPNYPSNHAITELVIKNKNLFPASLHTSPESPELRESRRFTYVESEDKETPLIKRPASFLLARENPILSGDLTHLLTRTEQPVETQNFLSFTKNNDDDVLSSLKPQHDSNKNCLKNTFDEKYSFENIHEEEHPTSEGSRTNSCKNAAQNVKVKNNGHTSKLSEKMSTLVDNEVCARFDENVKEPRALESKETKPLDLKMSAKSGDLDNTEKEHKQPAIPEQISVSGEAENMYENFNNPISNHQTQKSPQNVNKIGEVTNNSEEGKTISFPDSLTTAENALKKKALRFPNTSKHLMSHDCTPDPYFNGTKAKLTNWNSKEKLTKGSMDDLSHLEEDPWIKNSEAATSPLNIDEEPSTTLRPSLSTPTRSRGHSDVSELMQVSGHKENLDWMVYLNRISPSWSQIQSPQEEDLRVSTSAQEYSKEQENKEVNNIFPLKNPCVARPGNYLINENIKRRGSVNDVSESRTNTNNLNSRKGNAFGISPVTVSIIKPVSFSPRGLVRSNSTPISDVDHVVIDQAADKERPVSLDMGRITGNDCRNVAAMNSSESVKTTSEISSRLPAIRIEEGEEANSNRLSVVSSISTSSYDESQSNSSSDGLVGTLKNKLHAWTKQSRARHDSEVSCTSTLTSDDEETENTHTKSSNTFEPATKNRSSWKEDRQLEIVLREHSLGSSKLGSRMAHIYTHPLEPVVDHHHSDSSSHESHIQSLSSVDKVLEEYDKVLEDQVPYSASPSTETTDEFLPPVPRITDILESESELSLHSDKSNNRNQESSISASPTTETTDELLPPVPKIIDILESESELSLHSDKSNNQSQESSISASPTTETTDELLPPVPKITDILESESELSLHSDKSNNQSQESSISASPTTETTDELLPPVPKITDILESESELSLHSDKSNNQSQESSMSDPNPVQHVMSEASLELPDVSSKEAVPETTQQISESNTPKGNSDLARSDSTRSVHSNDSYYERRFSAVFDAEDFIQKSETDKHNEESNKEYLNSKKSIREYVKDLEEKFKAQSPTVFEVKRREPGTMIRQRLETLRESALHGWRNLGTSAIKPACDEKSVLFHHNRKTFTMENDNVGEDNSKFNYLKSSKSRDSFSKSVDNLSKSRDNVFLSASRDSLSSMSRSRDSLNSVSDVVGNRNSAPVFSLKTNHSGHEKDANRFHYRPPEHKQTFSGNQFIHRAYSGSHHSLSESEAHHVLENEIGSSSIKPAKSAYRLNEPSSDVDNLLVMKGWVKSLISKFQVKS